MSFSRPIQWCHSHSSNLAGLYPLPVKDFKRMLNFFLKLTRLHIFFSLKNSNFLSKLCVLFLFFKHYFSPLNTFMRKEKVPDPDFVRSTPFWGKGRIRSQIRIPYTGSEKEKNHLAWSSELTDVVINRDETKTNAVSSEPFLPSALPPSPKKRGPGFKVSRVGFHRVNKM